LARDLGRKIALEAALGSDWDFSALFRVDEGSPRGQPVEDQLSNAGSDIAEARVRQERQQEQEGQQRWQQEQERQQEQQEQRRPAQQQQKDHAVREQPTSHLHTNAARDSAVVLQSVKLSVRFHEALVRAASERVAASSALITQLPGAQTEAHISQLAEWFYSVLSALTEEGRAVVLGFRPDAAFSVNVAAGAPVVSLRPELTAVLRSADASELGDILTLQVQDVSEGFLQLVSIFRSQNTTCCFFGQ
jgi:chemotaxis protein histidine kinase CheA